MVPGTYFVRSARRNGMGVRSLGRDVCVLSVGGVSVCRVRAMPAYAALHNPETGFENRKIDGILAIAYVSRGRGGAVRTCFISGACLFCLERRA